MNTVASEVAHRLATTYDEHLQRSVNEVLHKFDKALRRRRAESDTPGYWWGTLAWAWKEEARLVGEHLAAMGVER